MSFYTPWERMTPHQQDLQRRREQAKRTFARLASQASEAGCEALAARFRIMGDRIGSTFSASPVPPALAAVMERRYPKLLKRAQADPKCSFYELMPAPRRTRQQVRDERKRQQEAAKQKARDEREALRQLKALAKIKPNYVEGP